MNWKKTVLICVLVLVFGTGMTAVIFMTEPTADRTAATKETAMLVDVTRAKRGTFQPTILATGTVESAQDIVLSPRVSGEVVARSPSFTPGGFVTKGETLLQIDPADFRNALEQRQSDLRQAVADFNLEMGRQNVAQQDYQLLDEMLTAENEALVLRKPQLNTARARVEAARSAVRQAELQLERTHIRAPFDAHILSRNANVGSQVSPGDDLGRLVGLDTYWVVTAVPLSRLRWISFPAAPEDRGSKVWIRNRAAWPKGEYRTGHVDRLVGALEGETRMARVLVTVSDPLARKSNPADVPSLMIGAFVEARIEAREITDVVRLDRDYVRNNDTVWVFQGGKLRIRDVDIVFRDSQYAYVREGLNEGDRVVTTNLATPVDGAELRLKGTGSTEAEAGSAAGAAGEMQEDMSSADSTE